jgi:hypothetical protein
MACTYWALNSGILHTFACVFNLFDDILKCCTKNNLIVNSPIEASELLCLSSNNEARKKALNNRHQLPFGKQPFKNGIKHE